MFSISWQRKWMLQWFVCIIDGKWPDCLYTYSLTFWFIFLKSISFSDHQVFSKNKKSSLTISSLMASSFYHSLILFYHKLRKKSLQAKIFYLELLLNIKIKPTLFIFIGIRAWNFGRTQERHLFKLMIS